MTKSCVGGNYKRPFYNKAKEMLFADKQVTSFTIGTFNPELYFTGNPLSPDVRFVQNGPSIDGWTPPARGRGTSREEPTIGLPAGRGRRGGAGSQ